MESKLLRRIKNLAHFLNATTASISHGFPGRKIKIIEVTGTSGKTTTAHLIYEIFRTAGKKVALISTISAIIDNEAIDTGFHVTTPSPHHLQKLLKQAVKAHTEYVVLEVTSHALDQHRTLGIPIDSAVITNITHEHLDYHRTFEKYQEAKAKILKNNRLSVLNMDDPSFGYLKNKAKGKVITFGKNKNALINPSILKIKLRFPGDFNEENALAAAAVSLSYGIDVKTVEKAVENFITLPGRMEEVANTRGFKVVIDFAHKPDALEKVLLTARDMTRGNVIVLFGCAGLRDVQKRSMMGEIAATYSDFAVFTAEDPRTEDVKEIIRQIANGAACKGMVERRKTAKISHLSKKSNYFFRIPDRAEAIDFAINSLAKPHDIILLCGKGHEKSMCYGSKEYPWDERKITQKALFKKI